VLEASGSNAPSEMSSFDARTLRLGTANSSAVDSEEPVKLIGILKALSNASTKLASSKYAAKCKGPPSGKRPGKSIDGWFQDISGSESSQNRAKIVAAACM